jgi:hypothetical protein
MATASLPAKPTSPGCCDPTEVMQRLGMDQPVDRLPAGNDGGERHDGDDEEPGQVFGPAEAIGVTPGRGPAGAKDRTLVASASMANTSTASSTYWLSGSRPHMRLSASIRRLFHSPPLSRSIPHTDRQRLDPLPAARPGSRSFP